MVLKELIRYDVTAQKQFIKEVCTEIWQLNGMSITLQWTIPTILSKF